MRIIDKNTDYYDYLQNSEDTIVFDRRGSYMVTKCIFGSSLYKHMDIYRCQKFPKEGFLLLQCGATYWILLVTISGVYSGKTNKYDWNRDIAEYSLDVISTWKNYDRPRTTVRLEYINFGFKLLNRIEPYISRKKKTFHELVLSNITAIQDAINNNDNVRREIMFGESKTPILTACGIKDLISPEDIFMAIEEHLSLLKTESERIDPIGATNNDKIEMHGFDTKTSFRGNQKGAVV